MAMLNNQMSKIQWFPIQQVKSKLQKDSDFPQKSTILGGLQRPAFFWGIRKEAPAAHYFGGSIRASGHRRGPVG